MCALVSRGGWLGALRRCVGLNVKTLLASWATHSSWRAPLVCCGRTCSGKYRVGSWGWLPAGCWHAPCRRAQQWHDKLWPPTNARSGFSGGPKEPVAKKEWKDWNQWKPSKEVREFRLVPVLPPSLQRACPGRWQQAQERSRPLAEEESRLRAVLEMPVLGAPRP